MIRHEMLVQIASEPEKQSLLPCDRIYCDYCPIGLQNCGHLDPTITRDQWVVRMRVLAMRQLIEDQEEQKEQQAQEARRQAIVNMAKAQAEIEGSVEVDDDAKVSEGYDNGAYVQAWVWVDFADTDLDKEKACFRNHYVCPFDGEQWYDVADCMCNDRCPRCDAEIEPIESEEIK